MFLYDVCKDGLCNGYNEIDNKLPQGRLYSNYINESRNVQHATSHNMIMPFDLSTESRW